MTLTYPRTMPEIGYRTITFELARQAVVAPERGGRLVSVDRGPARWAARFEGGNLSMADIGTMRAWLSSLQGGAKTFIGFDRSRRYPLNYTSFASLTRAGGGSFSAGTASTWSTVTARDQITLEGLPASFRLVPGDYVSLVWSSGAKRTLHRILDDATANGSGSGGWHVEPHIPTWVPAHSTSVAHLLDPACIMRIVPGSDSASVMMGRYGQCTFEAVQVLEA